MFEGASIVQGRKNNQVILDENGGIMVNSEKSKIQVNIEPKTPLQSQTPSTIESSYIIVNPTASKSNIIGAIDIIPLYYPTESKISLPTESLIDTSSIFLPEEEDLVLVSLYDSGSIYVASSINSSISENPIATAIFGNGINVSNKGFLCDFTDKSYYTDKPILPYEKTYYSKKSAIRWLKTNIPNANLAKSIFATIWAEQNAGEFFSNSAAYNHMGLQTDAGRWSRKLSELIIGRTGLREGGTNKCREFAVFKSSEDSLEALSIVLKSKGFESASNADIFAKLRLNIYVYLNLEQQNPQLYNKLYPEVKAVYNTAVSYYNSH